MNAKTAVSHPTSVDGSGVESKVMPVMPTKPLKLGAASADTVYTSPLFRTTYREEKRVNVIKYGPRSRCVEQFDAE